MKLIVQIPCFNEQETIFDVLNTIPNSIQGVNEIEILIIDDGSTDDTVKIAKEFGVHHIIKNIGNKGLGRSFAKGLMKSIELGADILVNTDGDNQYPSEYINELVKPIIEKRADIVIGDRQTAKVNHFSIIKKLFQWLGTLVTRILSGNKEVLDAVSGFRAYSKEAMLELNVTNQFSYVLDTTIQASTKGLKTIYIPIDINPPTRPSRLFKNIWIHIYKSGIGLLRTFAFYKPLRVFIGIGMFFFIIGLIPVLRFLYYYLILDSGDGKIQSLIIGGILLSMGVNCFALGIIGDLMSRNRNLIEQLLKNQKKQY